MEAVERNETILAAIPKPSRSWSGAFFALSASVLMFGLGQFLAGRRRRGVVFFLAALAVNIAVIAALLSIPFLPALIVMTPLSVILTLVIHADAFRCGLRSKNRGLGMAGLRVLAGLVFIVLAFFSNIATRTALYLRDHYVEAFVCNGGSMAPTLLPDDRFLVHKKTPYKRWDLVVFGSPQNPDIRFVMRLVGLPGETIELVDGNVLIDGRKHNPPPEIGLYENVNYQGSMDGALRGRSGAGCAGNPISLADNEYYFLGDNTSRSWDSRLWEFPIHEHQLGAVPTERIVGKATAIYWPPARWRLLK